METGLQPGDYRESPMETALNVSKEFARTFLAIGAVVLFVYTHAMFYPEKDHEAAMDRAPTFGL